MTKNHLSPVVNKKKEDLDCPVRGTGYSPPKSFLLTSERSFNIIKSDNANVRLQGVSCNCVQTAHWNCWNLRSERGHEISVIRDSVNNRQIYYRQVICACNLALCFNNISEIINCYLFECYSGTVITSSYRCNVIEA